MERGPQGDYTTSEFELHPCEAFVPHPLPPKPPLEVKEPLLHEAIWALGKLDGITEAHRDVRFILLYFYIRREAVLSSQIEGSMITVTQLLSYETEAAPGVPIDDVREVSTYVRALEHALRSIRGGPPSVTASSETPIPSSSPKDEAGTSHWASFANDRLPSAADPVSLTISRRLRTTSNPV